MRSYGGPVSGHDGGHDGCHGGGHGGGHDGGHGGGHGGCHGNTERDGHSQILERSTMCNSSGEYIFLVML